MSCHDIGRGLDSVTRVVIEMYDTGEITIKTALKLFYNELLCQHKKIHRFKVYKLYSLFVFQFIALEGFIHFIRYTVI